MNFTNTKISTLSIFIGILITAIGFSAILADITTLETINIVSIAALLTGARAIVTSVLTYKHNNKVENDSTSELGHLNQ